MSFTFPDPLVTTEFTAANGITYSWDNDGPGKWVIKGFAVEQNAVMKKGGDSMEGQLIINGPRKAGDDVDKPEIFSSVKVLSIDNAQNSSLQLRHSGNAKVYVGDTDISVASDIKFNRAAGAVVKTNVQDLLNISEREVAYLGRSIEDEDLITKKYVDDTKEFLQNEIIELEEEIDAIAPSVERGKWTFTAVGTVGQPGQFTMYDAEFGNGSPTGLFKSAKSIWFNEIDSEGTSHAFGDVDDGELLEIFIDGSPEFGLFEVVGQAHDETDGASSFWVVDVNFVRTNEATTAVGPGELCRFKIFMAPTGGDASGFVLKSGDTMTGKLQLDKPHGDSDNGDGFTIKGAIGNSYSSTTVSEQAGNLLQVYHNKDAPDAINYKGKIASPQNIVTKQYVDASATVSLNCGGSAKWKKGSLNDSTLEGSRYFGIEQAGSTSSSIGVGNVLYLNKLINSEGALQQMDKYTPTDSSYCEVYLGNELVFKGQLKPSTYKVANRNPNDIVCDFSTQYALVSKSGSNWSQSSTYKLILTGMKYTG